MKHLTLLRPGALLPLFLLLSIAFSAKAQNSDTKVLDQPGYYKIQVGDAEVIALSDGTITLDMGKLLFNEDPETIKQLFNKNFQSPEVEASTNVYLIHINNKLILIDAGAGALLGPTLGKLTNSLAHAGYRPEQIDAIFITHFHVDHVGGLMAGNNMVFPNATIYADEKDVAYWLSIDNAKKASAENRFFFDGARNSVEPYLKAGKLKTLKPGETFYSVIKPLPTPGHTPGHNSYLLESMGEKLEFWGDLVHAAAVQFSKPNVSIHFDVDAPKAYAQRLHAFNDASNGKYQVAVSHFPFPGIGHVRAESNHFVWVPANYTTLVK